jgi:hypothetical protein
LVVDRRFLELESLENGVVGVAERGRAVAAFTAEVNLVVLDAPQLLQGTLGRQPGVGVLEAHAQHAVQHKGHEADQGVGADAIGQAVEHRGDLDLGLEHPEPPLDVGQRLVARDHLGGVEIGGVRHQQQLAIVEFGPRERRLVDGVGEEVRLQIDLDDRGEMRIADGAEQPRLGARVA